MHNLEIIVSIHAPHGQPGINFNDCWWAGGPLLQISEFKKQKHFETFLKFKTYVLHICTSFLVLQNNNINNIR